MCDVFLKILNFYASNPHAWIEKVFNKNFLQTHLSLTQNRNIFIFPKVCLILEPHSPPLKLNFDMNLNKTSIYAYQHTTSRNAKTYINIYSLTHSTSLSVSDSMVSEESEILSFIKWHRLIVFCISFRGILTPRKLYFDPFQTHALLRLLYACVDQWYSNKVDQLKGMKGIETTFLLFLWLL